LFRYVLKKIRSLQLLGQNSRQGDNNTEDPKEIKLSGDLSANLEMLKNILGASYDFTVREFLCGHPSEHRCALIYLNGMTDKAAIKEGIIQPILDYRPLGRRDNSAGGLDTGELNIDLLELKILAAAGVKRAKNLTEILDGYFSGDSILLLDGSDQALLIDTRQWKSRNIEEAKTETIVRGPRAGFTEDLATNTVLLRRIIKNKDFTLETKIIGKETKTTVCLAYIRSITDPLLVREVNARLNKIKIDAVLESGYIEQFIEDAPASIFSTVANSEKPSVVAGKILEGRVAILVDGTPVVLTVPMLFMESFQSVEDYYSRPYYASLVRVLRFFSYVICVLLPGTYVALLTFHQELIPTNFLFTIANEQEGVPFPTLIDVLSMGAIFEILREAGIRLPRPVGQAISIVGALVIGQAAVAAGLVGAPVVILVSLTAVASFVVPPQIDSGTLLRLFFTFLGGFMGGIGILLGMISVFIHLSSLRSFGAPYLAPFSPFIAGDVKDTVLRPPFAFIGNRPQSIGPLKSQRMKKKNDQHEKS